MLLYTSQIIDCSTLQRIFELSEYFGTAEDLSLGSFEELWELLKKPDSDTNVVEPLAKKLKA
jgi:hypothetical protein